jgi:hypothetical protein
MLNSSSVRRTLAPYICAVRRGSAQSQEQLQVES